MVYSSGVNHKTGGDSTRTVVNNQDMAWDGVLAKRLKAIHQQLALIPGRNDDRKLTDKFQDLVNYFELANQAKAGLSSHFLLLEAII